jgi:hypothetical protein
MGNRCIFSVGRIERVFRIAVVSVEQWVVYIGNRVISHGDRKFREYLRVEFAYVTRENSEALTVTPWLNLEKCVHFCFCQFYERNLTQQREQEFSTGIYGTRTHTRYTKLSSLHSPFYVYYYIHRGLTFGASRRVYP